MFICNLGQKPYFETTDEELLIQLPQGLTLVPPDKCPEKVKIIMEKCWKFEVDTRCTFDEIVTIFQDDNIVHNLTEINLTNLQSKVDIVVKKPFKYTEFNTLLRDNEKKISETIDVDEKTETQPLKNNAVKSMKEIVENSNTGIENSKWSKHRRWLPLIIFMLLLIGVGITFLIWNFHSNDILIPNSNNLSKSSEESTTELSTKTIELLIISTTETTATTKKCKKSALTCFFVKIKKLRKEENIKNVPK